MLVKFPPRTRTFRFLSRIRKLIVRRKGRKIKGLKRRQRRLGRNSRYVVIRSLATEHHFDSIAEEEWPKRTWIHLLSYIPTREAQVKEYVRFFAL